MRLGIWLALLIVLGPRLASASVEVTRDGAWVSVRAEAAPLSDVLDRLARELGMKVVYEGGAPRNLVNASLANRTPAEAVLAVLEGLGLDYLARMDATGTRVEQLVIVRSTGGGTSPADTSTARPRPATHDDQEDEEEDVPLGKPSPSRQARPPAPSPGARSPVPNQAPSGTPPAPAPNAPISYPVSPFAPAPPMPPVLNPPAPAAPADDSGDEEPEEQ